MQNLCKISLIKFILQMRLTELEGRCYGINMSEERSHPTHEEDDQIAMIHIYNA